jgi:hypothetical protein
MGLDRKFINAIYGELFEKNFYQYETALNRPINADSDPYGKARRALSKLSESERAQVIDFLKVVIADAGSAIFGTIDGVHFPDNIEGDFSLMCDGEAIQGDLMDIFIEKAQEEGVYS